MATLWELITQPSLAVKEDDPLNGTNKVAADRARKRLEKTLDELDDLLRKQNNVSVAVDKQ